jgi:hypothetical protein
MKMKNMYISLIGGGSLDVKLRKKITNFQSTKNSGLIKFSNRKQWSMTIFLTKQT